MKEGPPSIFIENFPKNYSGCFFLSFTTETCPALLYSVFTGKYSVTIGNFLTGMQQMHFQIELVITYQPFIQD